MVSIQQGITVSTQITEADHMAIQIPNNMVEEFKEVIRRGTAFGTQTSPEMKFFADTLLGRISYTHTSKMLEVESGEQNANSNN